MSTDNPSKLRKVIQKSIDELYNDPLISPFLELPKEKFVFHAKNDSWVVRKFFFEKISKMNFKFHAIVARKIESIFKKRHNKDEVVFYNDVISKLFENQLHKHKENTIYFSKRGDSTETNTVRNSITTAINSFEGKWGVQVDTVSKILI